MRYSGVLWFMAGMVIICSTLHAQTTLTLPELLPLRFTTAVTATTYEDCRVLPCEDHPDCDAGVSGVQDDVFLDDFSMTVQHISRTVEVQCDTEDSTQMVEEQVLDLADFHLPATLYRIRLCGGREGYILGDIDEGLSPYQVVQEIRLTSYDQQFSVTIHGVGSTVNIETLLSEIFLNGTAYEPLTISDDSPGAGAYLACGEEVCETITTACTPAASELQNEIIDYLRTNAPDPSEISYPITLHLISLCGDATLWVIDDELDLIDETPIQTIRTITLNEPDDPITINDPVRGSDYIDDISVETSDPSCDAPSSGSILITITGPGADQITRYSIDGGESYQSSPLFQNLEDGGYSISVSNELGTIASDYPEIVILTNPCEESNIKTCSDGIDNDGDGIVDCADGDCANVPSCIPICDLINLLQYKIIGFDRLLIGFNLEGDQFSNWLMDYNITEAVFSTFQERLSNVRLIIMSDLGNVPSQDTLSMPISVLFEHSRTSNYVVKLNHPIGDASEMHILVEDREGQIFHCDNPVSLPRGGCELSLDVFPVMCSQIPMRYFDGFTTYITGGELPIQLKIEYTVGGSSAINEAFSTVLTDEDRTYYRNIERASSVSIAAIDAAGCMDSKSIASESQGYPELIYNLQSASQTTLTVQEVLSAMGCLSIPSDACFVWSVNGSYYEGESISFDHDDYIELHIIVDGVDLGPIVISKDADRDNVYYESCDIDTDGDGIYNCYDNDDDGDGTLTRFEDTNSDRDPTNDDVNMNGTPDYLDPSISDDITDLCQDIYNLTIEREYDICRDPDHGTITIHLPPGADSDDIEYSIGGSTYTSDNTFTLELGEEYDLYIRHTRYGCYTRRSDVEIEPGDFPSPTCETCDNGVDDDGDGFVDCDDTDCIAGRTTKHKTSSVCSSLDEVCVIFIDEFIRKEANSIWLQENIEVLDWATSFLIDHGCSETTGYYIMDIMNLKMNDNEINLDRVTELFEFLKNNPNGLVQGCVDQRPDFDLQAFSDLLNFQIPIEIIEQLHSYGSCGPMDPSTIINLQSPCFGIQPIEAGNSALVNIDYYAVEILTMPDLNNDGNPDDPEEIYQAIRDEFVNLSAGSAIIEGSNCDPPLEGQVVPFTALWNFEPYEEIDLSKWDLRSLGARFYINADTEPIGDPLVNAADLLNDNGAVVTSQEGELNWIFSTIYTPRSQSQPFSGNRQFGLRLNNAGNWEFFTRAIDRAHTTDILNILEKFPLLGGNPNCDELDYFNIANETWRNLQNKLSDFLGNDLVQIKEPQSVQLQYTTVYNKLKSDTPVNFVSCE